jgi:phosphate regulon transcriptional regulator PhoB
MKVLIVDDEFPIVESVAYNLRKEGYTVLTAENAEDCMRIVRSEAPDVIILDVMLPTASGFDVCRTLRRESDIPIIMLTARAEETDRVVGLELGADDYVTKPFSMRELTARVKSILRRRSAGGVTTEGRLQAGELIIDQKRHEVTLGGRVIDLSPKEYSLLVLLVSYPDQVFSRQALLDRVWGPHAFVEDRTVDVHIRWLREKIEEVPSSPRRLLTVRGVGYKLSSAG